MNIQEELAKWRHKHFNGRRDRNYNGDWLMRESQLEMAEYFYQLGLNSQMDKDAIIAEVKRRLDTTGDTSPWLCGKLEAFGEILDFLKEQDN